MADNINEVNKEFWEQAHQKHYKPLCYLCSRRLTNGDLAKAEDIVSEAFLRAMDFVENTEAIENPFGYLWKVSQRVWSAKRHKERSDKMESLELLSAAKHPTIEPAAFRILENQEYREMIRVEQGRLTPRESRLLELHLQANTCDEIASELAEDVRLTRTDLNAVRNKVRYRLRRAKAKSKGSGQS